MLGAVFTIDDDAAANEVVVFERAEDGTLSPLGSFATGGKGSGAGLGSQGALALSADGKILVVVDAGSNEITSFAVDGAKLTKRSHVSSGGTMPVSVTIHGELVYVLNAGGTSGIAGFRLDAQGMLAPIDGSARALSTAASGAAEIAFSPKGDALVVTEKATNMIDTFVVDASGMPSAGTAHASSGKTPFGFAITAEGTIVVSEANGAAAGAGTVSTYAIDATSHDLETLTPSLANQQTAPCWVATSADGKLAYSTNTPAGNLSSFTVGADGKLTLLRGVAIATGDGSRPVDLSFDGSSKHLYVLASGAHQILGFDVAADGSLTARAGAVTVPATAAGLVAR